MFRVVNKVKIEVFAFILSLGFYCLFVLWKNSRIDKFYLNFSREKLAVFEIDDRSVFEIDEL